MAFPRTDSTQAMKSIVSAYAEEDLIDDSEMPEDNISGSDDETSRPILDSLQRKLTEEHGHSSEEGTPEKVLVPARRAPGAFAKLVSYGADDAEGDEAREDESMEHEEDDARTLQLVDYNDTLNESHMTDSGVKFASHNEISPKVQLPPAPTSKCSNKLQEKISNLHQKMSGKDLNATIQTRKDFRNPSIYEKLITYLGIDEKGTNYPPELYNPLIWGKESYYDELAKAQKAEMDKREKERKDRTKVEFVTGTKKQTPDGTVVEQKRKSKWDSQAPSSSKPLMTSTSSNPPLASVSSSSGTKTVISSTGALKKPK